MLRRSIGFAAVLLSASAWAEEAAPAPAAPVSAWPAPVPGWVAPQPGEHPRLFFRKSDLPQLRKRAETPEGKAIIARLRETLGGGEAMPTVFNGSGKAYAGNTAKKDADGDGDDGKPEKGAKPEKPDAGKRAEPKSGAQELPVGAYTISHAAGFGLLYQLTGDRKYADLGRKCFEKAFEGVRDRDDRYSWKVPGGALRAGPSLGWYAVGYDLCYDGWDEDFRKRVAKELQDYDQGPHMAIADMAAGKRHGPGSNHWGPEIAGPALALLAVRGDPGTDKDRVEKLLAVSERSFLRQLTEGWGDHGWFAEGDGPGTISSDTAFVPALQAWKVAGGKDFVAPRPDAQWLTLKWVMLTVPAKGKPAFPLRGTYGHNVWSRIGMSGSGTFAQGFGAVEDRFRPALLWTFNHCVSPGGPDYDTVGPYPHRPLLALVNWPFGAEEKNPAEVLPRAVADTRMGFYMFRNRWKDDDDIIVTAHLKDTKGNYAVKGGPIMVWGLGERTAFPIQLRGKTTHWSASDAGGVVSSGNASLAVDFDPASGVDALIVMAAPVTPNRPGKSSDKVRVQTVPVDKLTYTVMTLSASGKHPDARAEGDKVVIGGRTVRFDGEKIVLEKTQP